MNIEEDKTLEEVRKITLKAENKAIDQKLNTEKEDRDYKVKIKESEAVIKLTHEILNVTGRGE